MKEGSHKKVQKIRMDQNGPPYLSVTKKISGGHRVVHHLQQEHHQSMKEGSHKKVQKIRMVRNGPPYLSVKKNSGGQQEEGHGVVHHLQQEHHQSMKEGSHKKVKKTRMVQNGPPYLSVKKKFRWIARVRTWSSPPSSARISSILLDAPFSKCQGLTRKYYGPTIQPTTLTTPTNPSTRQTYPPTPPITFNHERGVPQKSSESKKVL